MSAPRKPYNPTGALCDVSTPPPTNIEKTASKTILGLQQKGTLREFIYAPPSNPSSVLTKHHIKSTLITDGLKVYNYTDIAEMWKVMRFGESDETFEHSPFYSTINRIDNQRWNGMLISDLRHGLGSPLDTRINVFVSINYDRLIFSTPYSLVLYEMDMNQVEKGNAYQRVFKPYRCYYKLS
jgi:hypothetical protein